MIPRKTLLFATLVLDCWTTAVWAIGPAPTWHPRQLVAANVNIALHQGADRILAFDHYGDPGIAYALASPDTWLMYARFVPGIGWQSGIADGGNRGTYPSLAFDRRELPVIGYSSISTKRPVVNNFNGTFWSAQYADVYDEDLPGTGGYNSLAIDSTGKIATAYQHALSGTLKYVKDTDGDGLITDETPQPIPLAQGYYASLAFDPLNRPMIAHYDATSRDLKFSVLDTGLGWLTTTVESAGFTGSHLSMAIDPDTGYPAISYYDESVGDLRYAAWNGTSWDRTTIDSAGNVGLATSLAFNPFGNGFPAVAYGDNLNNLYFIEDPPAVVPEASTIALGNIGLMLVAFYRQRPAN